MEFVRGSQRIQSPSYSPKRLRRSRVDDLRYSYAEFIIHLRCDCTRGCVVAGVLHSVWSELPYQGTALQEEEEEGPGTHCVCMCRGPHIVTDRVAIVIIHVFCMMCIPMDDKITVLALIIRTAKNNY